MNSGDQFKKDNAKAIDVTPCRKLACGYIHRIDVAICTFKA